jgi:SAM-dependent methyltransferase
VFDRGAFDDAYRQLVLGGNFFELDNYYRGNWSRYRRTFELLSSLPLESPARLLEVGGGQIALLSRYLYGDHCTVADVNEEFNSTLLEHEIEFVKCDLLRGDLPFIQEFDAVVLLEVVEHIPLPLHQVLERVRRWMKPGGYLFVRRPTCND